MVDKLGFGGAALTSVGSLSEIIKLLNFTYDNGITHFDTAPLYGKGYSEIIYGKFIHKKRDNLTITTKFGFGEDNNSQKILLHPLLFANYWSKKMFFKKNANVFNSPSIYTGLNHRVIEKEEIEKSFIRSIKNLKVNYLDYFLLHEGIPSFLTEEAFFYLSNLKKNGDILKIGIATNINTLVTLQDSELDEWDVLQYEGFDLERKELLRTRFPDKEHIHHSCLTMRDSLSNDIHDNMPSSLLAKAVLENLEGKVIFSSRNRNRISDNINAVVKLIKR